MPWARTSATSCEKSSMVPSSGSMAVWPPSWLPMAHGLPGSSTPAVRVLLGPFRAVWPMGWMGGRYSTSKPMAASSGTRAATPLKPPNDRGNSSYQAPNEGPLPVDPEGLGRRGGEVGGALGAPQGRGHRRRQGRGRRGPRRSRLASSRASQGRRPRRGRLGARPQQQLAPSAISTSMAWPASSLARTLWAQVACRSVQASTTMRCGPMRLGHHRRLPLVVAEGGEHGRPPRVACAPWRPEQDPAGQQVVAVLEHHGPHPDRLPDHRLGEVPGRGRPGADVFDHEPSRHTANATQLRPRDRAPSRRRWSAVGSVP